MKYNIFKSFGETYKLPHNVELLKITQDIEVIYNPDGDSLTLTRTTVINENTVRIAIREDGIRMLRFDFGDLIIIGYIKNHYRVDTRQEVIDKCLETGIITSFRKIVGNLQEFEVKFNKSLKLTFNDVPSSLLDFFNCW